MTLDFEKAREADLDRLLTFMEAYYALDHLPFDAERARAALRGLLADDARGRLWMIRVDGAAAGYLALTLGYSLEYHGRDAFIDELYLEPNYRGRGLGRRVMAFAEDEARALGVRALHLEVERANEAAHALYRNVGYEDHDRFLMTKWLT